MSGRIVKQGPAPAHYCSLPGLWTRTEPPADRKPDPVTGMLFNPSKDVVWTRIGTVWECDCGKTWIVRWVDSVDGRRFTICAHSEWQPETRRERKRRLRDVLAVCSDITITGTTGETS